MSGSEPAFDESRYNKKDLLLQAAINMRVCRDMEIRQEKRLQEIADRIFASDDEDESSSPVPPDEKKEEAPQDRAENDNQFHQMKCESYSPYSDDDDSDAESRATVDIDYNDLPPQGLCNSTGTFYSTLDNDTCAKIAKIAGFRSWEDVAFIKENIKRFPMIKTKGIRLQAGTYICIVRDPHRHLRRNKRGRSSKSSRSKKGNIKRQKISGKKITVKKASSEKSPKSNDKPCGEDPINEKRKSSTGQPKPVVVVRENRSNEEVHTQIPLSRSSDPCGYDKVKESYLKFLENGEDDPHNAFREAYPHIVKKYLRKSLNRRLSDWKCNLSEKVKAKNKNASRMSPCTIETVAPKVLPSKPSFSRIAEKLSPDPARPPKMTNEENEQNTSIPKCGTETISPKGSSKQTISSIPEKSPSVPTLLPKSLAISNDKHYLNKLHQYVRSDLLELVQESSGKVGIQCVFCKGKPDKAPMAMSFPNGFEGSTGLYRTVCAWQRVHFKSCKYVPDNVKKTYDELKVKDTSRGRVQYWIDSAELIGLNQRENGGLEFSPDSKCSGASNTAKGDTKSSNYNSKKPAAMANVVE